MYRVLGFLVALGYVASAAAASQSGEERFKWWQSDRVKAEAGLSDEQSAQLETLFQATLPKMRAEKEELDRQERELAALMSGAGDDESGVSQAIDRVEAARSRANKTRVLMLYRMYRVLTPDQRQKLEAIHERVKQSRRSRGSR
jgi:Spy/CpxP family protein refolding chaperone